MNERPTLDQAVTIRPAKARVPPSNGGTREPPIRFQLTRFKDVLLHTSATYLVKGLLPSAGLVVVWGEPKCGKSFWTFDLLIHVALGWEYRGQRVCQGPVVYCALEGQHGFKRRMQAFRIKRLAMSPVDPEFFLMETPLNLAADHKQLIADIRRQVGAAAPIAVCFDTLNRSIAGSESDDKDMSAYIRAADAIHAAFRCLVVIVHHCGHEAKRPRGHSSLMGALDVQISVKRDPASNIVAEIELAKDAEPGLQFVSRLERVEIGYDEDGEPITSCVVEAVEGPSAKASPDTIRRLPKAAQTALRALKDAIEEVGEQPPASNHIPPGLRTVTVDQWRGCAYQRGISDSTEPRARQAAFKRAHEALVAGKHVSAWGEHRWPAN